MLSPSEFRLRVMLHFAERAVRKYEARYGSPPTCLRADFEGWGVDAGDSPLFVGEIVLTGNRWIGSTRNKLFAASGGDHYTRCFQATKGPNEW